MATIICSTSAGGFVIRSSILLLLLSLSLYLFCRDSFVSVRGSFWFDSSSHPREDHSTRLQSITSAAQSIQAIFEGGINPNRHHKIWNDHEATHHHTQTTQAQADSTTTSEWTPHTRDREERLRQYTQDLCIVIQTVPRRQRYFEQTIASVLHALSPDMQQATSIYVLNGAIPQSQFKSHILSEVWQVVGLHPPSHISPTRFLVSSSLFFSRIHSDAFWLDRQLSHLRHDVNTRLWPNMHVLHSETRQAARRDAIREKAEEATTSGSNTDIDPIRAFLRSYDPHLAPWQIKKAMDYVESMNICYQHHSLQRRSNLAAGSAIGSPRVSFNRSLMYTLEGDWIFEFMTAPERALTRVITHADLAEAIFPQPTASAPGNRPANNAARAPPPLSLILEDDIVVAHDFVRKMYAGLMPLWSDATHPPPSLAEGEDGGPSVVASSAADDAPVESRVAGLKKIADVIRGKAALFATTNHISTRRSAQLQSAPAVSHTQPYAFARLFLSPSPSWRIVDFLILIPVCLGAAIACTLIVLVLDWLQRVATRICRRTRRRDEQEEGSKEEGVTTALDPYDAHTNESHHLLLDLDRLDVGVGVGMVHGAPSVRMKSLGTLSHAGAQSTGRTSDTKEWQITGDQIEHRTARDIYRIIRATPLLPHSSSRFGRLLPLLILIWLLTLILLATLVSIGRPNLYFGGLFNAEHVEDGLHVIESDVSVADSLAMVYPSVLLPDLMHHLVSRSGQPGDVDSVGRIEHVGHSLQQFARTRGYLQYHLTPDLVQHVGLSSSATFKNQGAHETIKISNTFQP